MASVALTKGALWMQNVDYPAVWDRALIDALYASEGVIDGFAVTPNGGLGLAISGGRAVVSGDDTAANQGKYLVDQDAQATLTVASVGSNRTEYVWISINDTAVAGGRAGNNVTIETSTTAPPASALLIATLTLTTGTSTITAGMIADNRVFTDVVAPGSISTAKIADSAVAMAKIADGAVWAPKIADAAVTTAKIANGAVTLAKLEATLQTTLSTIDPADAIIAVAGSTAPTGWGLCNGGLELIASYPATYARIGTVYGGDGITTFGKPDLQSRFISGKGTAGWSNVLGESGGSKDAVVVTHTHTTADHSHNTADHSHNTPDHYHSFGTSENGAHGHGFGGGTVFIYSIGSGGLSTPFGAGWALTGGWIDYGAAGGLHSHSGSTGWASDGNTTYGATGGAGNTTYGATGNVGNTTNSQTPSTGGIVNADGVDDNLPPYLTLNYCIRLR